jgi:cytochrome c peroxidase
MGKAACGTCHFAPLFSGTVPPDYTESESEVLGTPLQWPVKKPEADLDPGRAGARLKEDVEIYRYSFKTPSIRNIEITSPYMHNGGMKTLEAVMDFYNKGGGNGIGLNFEHQTLASDKLNLSKQEISQIIAFMKSLTDYRGLLDKPKSLPKFTDSTLNSRTIGGDY